MNKTAFQSGWEVASGAVDMIGVGGVWDLIPGGGRYVDLDGSIFAGGMLTKSFDLLAGVSYSASFYLAGNQRGAGSDQVDVSFGTQLVSFLVKQDQAFSRAVLLFTPDKNGRYVLGFRNLGRDNMGALLDDVEIDMIDPRNLQAPAAAVDIPEPSTGFMVLAGFGLAGWFGRRQTQAKLRLAVKP